MTARRLFIVRPTLGAGGADRVTLTLLKHLEQTRFTPTLVLIRRQGELLDELPDDVEIVSLDAGGIFSAARPLRKLIRQRRPDIVFSTSSGTNVTAALATPRPGPRLVLSERNGLLRDQDPLKKWVLFAAKRLLYPRADCVTAVSRGVAKDLERRLRLHADRLRVVYNPVLTSEIDELALRPVDDPWLASGPPVLVAAGRLQPAKGFDLLLAAVAELRRTLDCRLIILGEGPLRPVLERQARELGLDEAVRLPGFVANPYAYMSRATAFVLSSHFEGLPGVLIQAMACGAPVVATRCPFGPEEIIEDGVDGMLVPTDSVAELTAGIRTLLTDEPLRARLGAAARESVQRFQLREIMPNYVSALDPEPE